MLNDLPIIVGPNIDLRCHCIELKTKNFDFVGNPRDGSYVPAIDLSKSSIDFLTRGITFLTTSI